MAKINTRAFGTAAIVAFSVAVIFPAVFGEPASFNDRVGGDPWWNFAYNFQTLITGVIAVAAAYLTVRQMRLTDEEANRRHNQLVSLSRSTDEKADLRHNQLVSLGQATDEKADLRHNQLIKLSLQPDKLRVERLLYPQFGELRENHRTLRKLDWPAFHEQPTTEKWREEQLKLTARQYDEIQSTLSEIGSILSRPAVEEAENLFGGILRRDVDEARGKSLALAAVMYDFTAFANMVRDYGPAPEVEGDVLDQRRRHAEDRLLKIRSEIAGLLEHLDGVFQGLYKLSDFYGVSE